MKRRSALIAGLGLTIIIVLAAGYLFLEQQQIMNVDDEGTTSIDQDTLRSTINQMPKGTLTDLEKEGILYMREEEKLARDVYLKLYEKWNQQTFNNIADAEETHMNAVKTLIEKYELEDPATQEIGKFNNPELQQLYNDLIQEGNKSLYDALKVGAAIEEIDIIDLKEYLTYTEKEDIKLVYENLMKGSRNHLRAFVKAIERQGQTYTPQYLSQEEYDEIINSPTEKGSN